MLPTRLQGESLKRATESSNAHCGPCDGCGVSGDLTGMAGAGVRLVWTCAAGALLCREAVVLTLGLHHVEHLPCLTHRFAVLLSSRPPQWMTTRASSATPGATLPPSAAPSVSRMSRVVAWTADAGRAANVVPQTCSANARAGSAGMQRSPPGIQRCVYCVHPSMRRLRGQSTGLRGQRDRHWRFYTVAGRLQVCYYKRRRGVGRRGRLPTVRWLGR